MNEAMNDAMNDASISDPFKLCPFSPSATDAELSIACTVTRQLTQLHLRYVLSGALTKLAIAPPTTPTRQHNLWSTTCFECFLGTPEASRYWEFNLSPAGPWNVYRLTDYRQGLEEESAFSQLPFQVSPSADRLELDVAIDLMALDAIAANPAQPLILGITTVVQFATGDISYWALQHCGAEADFHLRHSWTVQL
jgi:hypothetical protein